MISGLAFFDYDQELADYCELNLKPLNMWEHQTSNPNLIRLNLRDLKYYFIKAQESMFKTQRARLPKDLFYQLVLLPTSDARIELNKTAYKELGYDLGS